MVKNKLTQIRLAPGDLEIIKKASCLENRSISGFIRNAAIQAARAQNG